MRLGLHCGLSNDVMNEFRVDYIHKLGSCLKRSMNLFNSFSKWHWWANSQPATNRYGFIAHWVRALLRYHNLKIYFYFFKCFYSNYLHSAYINAKFVLCHTFVFRSSIFVLAFVMRKGAELFSSKKQLHKTQASLIPRVNLKLVNLKMVIGVKHWSCLDPMVRKSRQKQLQIIE